ncbi:MAG: hypothetical protein ACEQSB_02610 [Undibacterium sp.]
MNSMEQPPKMPEEQIPLDFGDSAEPVIPEAKEVALETLSTDKLEILFEKSVGYSAQTRFLGWPEPERRSTLIEGIKHPAKGKEAVGAWDAEYEKIGDAWSGK